MLPNSAWLLREHTKRGKRREHSWTSLRKDEEETDKQMNSRQWGKHKARQEYNTERRKIETVMGKATASFSPSLDTSTSKICYLDGSYSPCARFYIAQHLASDTENACWGCSFCLKQAPGPYCWRGSFQRRQMQMDRCNWVAFKKFI